MDYNKLLEILKGHRVFIQTHNFPDPDAIASAFGIQEFLKKFGIHAEICYDGKIEKITALSMLEAFKIRILNISDITDMTADDYIITVDAQKLNANITDFIGDEVACIDHHKTYNHCSYLYKDIRMVGSCSSIIADYFFQSGIEMSADVATALLYGLKMDTERLSRGVTDFDVDIFSRLFKIADRELLTRLESNSMEFSDLKAYGTAIENIQVYGRIGFAYIPFNCPDGLIAMICDFILDLDEIDFSVVYSLREDGIKFSVRSALAGLDAGNIIRKAFEDIGSGGGHATMAGGFIPKGNIGGYGADLEFEVQTRFIDVIGNTKFIRM